MCRSCNCLSQYLPARIITILIILCTFLPLSACKDDKQGLTGYPPAPVTTAKAELKNTPYYLTAIGTVKAIDSITVRSRVTGYLSRIFIKDGQEVTEGQQLFTMDPSPYEASIGQLRAELASDKTKYEQARKDYNRYRDLVERKVVSEENFEEKRLDMKTASDAIAVTQAKLEDARNDLKYCFIRSPIDGLAGYVNPTEGNLIEENKDELVVINKISPIAVNFYLPQKYLAEVQKYSANKTLEVLAITEGRDKPEIGELVFIDNNVDTKTGTIWMQGRFENSNNALWPGNYVEVRLKLYEEDVIRIPMEATCTGPEGKFVWIAHSNNTVDMQPVSVERRMGKLDILSKGLKDKEVIVSDGQLRLFPGAAITVKNSGNNTSAAPKASKEKSGE
ncbi:efflux RND transporter periplasmic adaptor subunit [Desulfovibrio sp. JC010]|uniref:efflux RND transporter periplasmic adaptor subunit n=1 Tax=Desulfovibrio sp. JC010 TaxID=2593641 RepID=UPI0013D2048A|nr:efflux RND transporter periplasmic adaptor subunit [Desulfovibrio sp. JC010]NDV26448.1 efflux RND transporter periplasmic adaptor subunit [Desulfovibrio sp. JC010]